MQMPVETNLFLFSEQPVFLTNCLFIYICVVQIGIN